MIFCTRVICGSGAALKNGKKLYLYKFLWYSKRKDTAFNIQVREGDVVEERRITSFY
jgi:hypothetical protein